MTCSDAVSKKAKIAEDVKIGHYCVIEDDVVIGPGTVIRSFVEIRNGTRIGAGCYIDSGVKISGDAKIADGVVLRFDCVIARGCEIGDRTYVSPQAMFQNLDHKKERVGGAKIGADCFIGTNVTFSEGIRVADNITIASKSMVTKDLLDSGFIYLGIPAAKVRKKEVVS